MKKTISLLLIVFLLKNIKSNNVINSETCHNIVKKVILQTQSQQEDTTMLIKHCHDRNNARALFSLNILCEICDNDWKKRKLQYFSKEETEEIRQDDLEILEHLNNNNFTIYSPGNDNNLPSSLASARKFFPNCDFVVIDYVSSESKVIKKEQESPVHST